MNLREDVINLSPKTKKVKATINEWNQKIKLKIFYMPKKLSIK